MSGNITEYRINLVKKIGVEQVEWLEGKHEAKHYSVDDLKEIKEIYKRKLKENRNEETNPSSTDSDKF
jgi:isocitrate dehydrogenase kinase/phosphatase